MEAHVHHFDSACNIFLYKRKYLGKGLYYMRVAIKSIKEGDLWQSFTHNSRALEIHKILSVKDSKAIGKNTLFEVEAYDPTFSPLDVQTYLTISNI